MNILSVFDGMSCGQIALNRAGIKYDKYYASEIDKYAIKVAQHNYPSTIQLGSVIDMDTSKLPKIDLLIGGSPCQSFSFAGKRKGMITKDNIEVTTLEQYLELKQAGFEFEGQSYLFWEYVRILKEVKPKYFLLENVKMVDKWKGIISSILGVEPIEINSALVSAQNRKRLYWTNIKGVEQPEDKGILLKDILESGIATRDKANCLLQRYSNFSISDAQVNRAFNKSMHNVVTESVADTENLFIGSIINRRINEHGKRDDYNKEIPLQPFLEIWEKGKEKSNCLTTVDKDNVVTNLEKGRYQLENVKNRFRKLTTIECERLQTVPDNYTACVSDNQKYKMLGNGWTVDVIAHIFSYIDK